MCATSAWSNTNTIMLLCGAAAAAAAHTKKEAEFLLLCRAHRLFCWQLSGTRVHALIISWLYWVVFRFGLYALAQYNLLFSHFFSFRFCRFKTLHHFIYAIMHTLWHHGYKWIYEPVRYYTHNGQTSQCARYSICYENSMHTNESVTESKKKKRNTNSSPIPRITIGGCCFCSFLFMLVFNIVGIIWLCSIKPCLKP